MRKIFSNYICFSERPNFDTNNKFTIFFERGKLCKYIHILTWLLLNEKMMLDLEKHERIKQNFED